MPLYDYRCGEGHRFERLVPLAFFHASQKCECGSLGERLICAPRLGMSDSIAPTMGADGRLHDSLASYRRSLTPSGNPKGERFLELGSDALPEHKPPPVDRRARRDAIKAGMADVKAGRVPPVVTGGLP